MKIFTFYPTPIFYIPTFGTFFYLRARLYDPHSYKLLQAIGPRRLTSSTCPVGCLLSTSIFSTARIASREDYMTKLRSRDEASTIG